jgi:two-component system OmpR family response regulator
MIELYRVVSVEDDLGIFDIIRASLRQLPIDLRHAGTGRAGLALISEYQPKLVILDISLPDMNGWDVLQGVDKMGVSRPEVIVLTAFTNPTHRLIGHLHNVTYMNKPFLPKELLGIVRQVLGIE